MIPILVAVAAYAVGTFPSAVLVARSSGIDITAEGSGNPGASNVTRVLGWRRGLLVFTLDAAKGALAAGAGWLVLGRHGGYACAGAAALGHMFPLWRSGSQARRFSGGKGVATVGGTMFVLQPIVSPILAMIWFAVSRITGKASIASVAIIPLMPLGAAALGAPAWEIVAIIALGALVLIKHTANIKRLIRREELRLDKNR